MILEFTTKQDRTVFLHKNEIRRIYVDSDRIHILYKDDLEDVYFIKNGSETSREIHKQIRGSNE